MCCDKINKASLGKWSKMHNLLKILNVSYFDGCILKGFTGCHYVMYCVVDTVVSAKDTIVSP